MLKIRAWLGLSLIVGMTGCANSPAAFFDELGEDFAEGPGQVLPEIVGASAKQIYYATPPAELQISEWLPSFAVNLHARDLESGEDQLLAVLLPTEDFGRYSLRSDGIFAVWSEFGVNGDRVELQNLSLGERETIYEVTDGYISQVELSGSEVAIAVNGSAGARLELYDILTGITRTLWEADHIQALAFRGGKLVIAADGAIMVVASLSGDTQTVATSQLVDVLDIEDSVVAWSGSLAAAGFDTSTRLAVYVHNLDTGNTRTVTILEEGAFEFIEGLLDGEQPRTKVFRGLVDGKLVITESIERPNFDLREKVRFVDAVDASEKLVGDFKNRQNIFWRANTYAEVVVTNAEGNRKAIWYNPDGNRIVVHENGSKRKFRPTE